MASADGPGAGPGVADPLVGKSFGSYRVIKLIGAGGMGAVYLAEQPRIGKRVAVKVLHPAYAHDRDVLTRFFREAQLVNQIRHENLIDVLDFGDTGGPDGAPYLIMELLEGDPLSRRLARGPLAEDQARHIGAQVARALEAAHGAGVVHRDLKPENVFLVQRGQDSSFVKLLDFGIAKLARGSTGGGAFTGRALTAVGSMIGTPLYMSPEQIRGREVGPATDLYALGCLLHEMVTGAPPFSPPGGTLEMLIEQHLNADPPALRHQVPALSPEYEALTLRCLAKDPAGRPARAAEVARTLAAPATAPDGPRAPRDIDPVALAPTAAVEVAAAAPPPELATLESRRPAWRRPLLLAAGGLALLTTGLMLGIFWPRGGPPPAVPPAVPAMGPTPAAPTRGVATTPRPVAASPAAPAPRHPPPAPARTAPRAVPVPAPRAATYPALGGRWRRAVASCPLRFPLVITLQQGAAGQLTFVPRIGPPAQGTVRPEGRVQLASPLMTCSGQTTGLQLDVRCLMLAEGRTCTTTYHKVQ